MADKKPRLTFYQVLLIGTFLFSLVTAFQIFRAPYDAEILFRSRRWMAGLGLASLIILAEISLLYASQTGWQTIIEQRFEASLTDLQRLGKINRLIFGLVIGVFALLVLDLASGPLGNNLLRLFTFWVLALVGALLLRGSDNQIGWGRALAISLLTAAFFYRILAYLPDLSTHPLSLGWSEASRYYYASLYFSDRIYGMNVPPTVLHPSRYLMQSIPFLILDSPIWLHRLWQILLWLVTTSMASIFLVRRLKIGNPYQRWGLYTWSFLFLLVGPVYYHLTVPLIIILWGYDRQKPWRTLLAVVVASAWSGISRINWFPVPGMLAASLYILEKPVSTHSFWRYWLKPVVWTVLGTGIAFAAQAAYAVLSGNPPEQFTSSLTSDLLWYRLLPNPTYPEGVLLSALIVSLPMLAVILARLKGRWQLIHPLRLLGLGTILLVLFAGGLVVSTKIGGGSNLHNLDAFLSLFMIVTASAVIDRIAWEPNVDQAHLDAVQPLQIYQTPIWRAWLILAIVIPIYPAVLAGAPYTMPDSADTQDAMVKIERFIDRMDPNRDEVLFIDERQLVTFQTIEDVKLVPDYEKVFLMEMAMAGNPDYLERFHSDLKNHRFSVIISEPLFITTKGPSEPFGEENDAWVEQVSRPVLCYYESARFLRATALQILVPRDEPGIDCP